MESAGGRLRKGHPVLVDGVTMNLEDAVTSRRLTKTVCAKMLKSCRKSRRRLRGDDASADDG